MSCQRPASNGIIVPRDSGPLTTSALEKSQKQTASANKSSPQQPSRAQLPGRGAAAQAASAAPGQEQTPRLPQHDPPRRSGTVCASLYPSSIAWAPRSQLPFCQAEKPCKGPPGLPENSPCSAVFPCTQLEQFAGAQMRSSTHFKFSLPENEFVNIEFVSGFWKASRSNLQDSRFTTAPDCKRATLSPTSRRALQVLPSWAARRARLLVYYLWDRGLARRTGIFKTICLVMSSGLPHLPPGDRIISLKEGAPSPQRADRRLHKDVD